jgi:hypothetical protein
MQSHAVLLAQTSARLPSVPCPTMSQYLTSATAGRMCLGPGPISAQPTAADDPEDTSTGSDDEDIREDIDSLYVPRYPHNWGGPRRTRRVHSHLEPGRPTGRRPLVQGCNDITRPPSRALHRAATRTAAGLGCWTGRWMHHRAMPGATRPSTKSGTMHKPYPDNVKSRSSDPQAAPAVEVSRGDRRSRLATVWEDRGLFPPPRAASMRV